VANNNSSINIVINAVNNTGNAINGVLGGLRNLASSAAGSLASIGLVSEGIKAVAGVFSGIGATLQGFVNDATDANAASLRLASNLKNISGGSQEETNALIAQANALQEVTGLSGDLIVSSQAVLATFGANSSQIAELTPQILNLAENQRRLGESGLDLEKTATLVGKALDGNLSPLLKLGVQMSAAEKDAFALADKQERMAIVAKILDRNFGGLAETVGSGMTGAVRRLTEAQGDLSESFGNAIIENQAIADSVDSVANGYIDFQNAISDNKDEIEASLTASVAVVVTLLNTIKLFWNGFEVSFKGVALGILEVSALIAKGMEKITFGSVSEKWKQESAELSASADSLKQSIQEDFADSGKAIDGIKDPLGSLQQEHKKTVSGITADTKEMLAQYKQATATIEKDFTGVKKALEFDAQVSKENLDANLATIKESLAAELLAIDAKNISETAKSDQKNKAILTANKQSLDAKLSQASGSLSAIQQVYEKETAAFSGSKLKQAQIDVEFGLKKKAIYQDMATAYKASLDDLNKQEQQHRDKAIALETEIANFKKSAQDGLREIQRAGMTDAEVVADKQLEIDQKTNQMRDLLRNQDYQKAAELGKELTNLSKQQALDAAKGGDYSSQIIAQGEYQQSVELTTQALEAQKAEEKAKAEEAKALAAEQLKASQDLAKSIAELNTSLSQSQTILLKVDQTQLDEAYQTLQNFPTEKTVTIKTVETHNAGGFVGMIRRFASGGSVPGAGNSDTVPAMLTPGEFVIRKAAAQRLSPQFLNALNSGKINNAASAQSLGAYDLNLRMGDINLPASVSSKNQDVLKTLIAQLEQQKRVQR
jgi:hypothetical protein